MLYLVILASFLFPFVAQGQSVDQACLVRCESGVAFKEGVCKATKSSCYSQATVKAREKGTLHYNVCMVPVAALPPGLKAAGKAACQAAKQEVQSEERTSRRKVCDSAFSSCMSNASRDCRSECTITYPSSDDDDDDGDYEEEEEEEEECDDDYGSTVC